MTSMETPNRTPTHEHSALLAALLVIPVLIFVARQPLSPAAAWMNDVFSLSQLPRKLQGHAEFVLFVPLSAIVVSLFRLTLGLPVLGLFRPILTALAFRMIGIPLGLAFLVAVLGGVVVIKPLLKEAHYYVRVPLVLSLAAACLVLPLLVDRWWHVEALRHVAYFPLINLALMCDAFTKILNKDGLRAALWPTTNAVLAAIVITLLAGIPGALHVLLGYPEVLLAQAGVILAIGKYLGFELFADRNPFIPKRPAVADAPQAPSPPPRLELVGE